MAQASISKRLKVTRTGKILRRAMALGHNRGNKSSTQKYRKKGFRGLVMTNKKLGRFLAGQN